MAGLATDTVGHQILVAAGALRWIVRVAVQADLRRSRVGQTQIAGNGSRFGIEQGLVRLGVRVTVGPYAVLVLPDRRILEGLRGAMANAAGATGYPQMLMCIDLVHHALCMAQPPTHKCYQPQYEATHGHLFPRRLDTQRR